MPEHEVQERNHDFRKVETLGGDGMITIAP